MKKTLMFCLLVVTLFSLCCCTPKIEKITDFDRFTTMTRQTDKIEVEFDNNSGKAFCFTITDTAQIENIMEIIFSASFNNVGKVPPVGDNTHLAIVQGENTFHLHFRFNKQGNYYFAFANDRLQQAIREIATQRGAFDGVK